MEYINSVDEDIVSTSVEIQRSYKYNLYRNKPIYIKNSLSGSFTPFVKIYDNYYFTPDREPCDYRYQFDKSLHDEGYGQLIDVSTFDSYIRNIEERQEFNNDLEYEKIIIFEKED